MKNIALLLIITIVACSGCNNNKGYTVDKNDPASVENASKSPPITLNGDGSPVVEGQAPGK